MFGEAKFIATPADDLTAKKARERLQDQLANPVEEKPGLIKKLLAKLAS
jgi:hypothetical protein